MAFLIIEILSYRDSPKVQISNKMKELLRKKSCKNKLITNQTIPNESELLSEVYSSHKPDNTLNSTKLSHQLNAKLRSQSKPKIENRKTNSKNKFEEMKNKKKCKLYKQDKEETKDYQERIKKASRSPNITKNSQNYLDFNSNVSFFIKLYVRMIKIKN